MRENESLEHVILLWLNEKKNYIKSSTYTYYLFEVENYIIPQLGALQMSDLNEKVIQNAVLYWQKQGGKEQTPLKKSTVQNLAMLIKQFLRYAIREGYMEEHPINIRFIPANQGKKKKVFSTQEQLAIINAIREEPSYRTFGILLCLNSGLRIGELCALRWEDFDLDNGIIHINKTLQRIYDYNGTPKTRIIISTPKTSTSIREIPLSSKMMDVIKTMHEKNAGGYVLTNSSVYMEPRSFRKFYMDFLERHKIMPLNFHCLRHTFATRCIENGSDYKSVSEILGHTTINTTLNMYVHPQLEEKRKCVELLQW